MYETKIALISHKIHPKVILISRKRTYAGSDPAALQMCQ
ncbi:hypothetical protein SAMN05216188_103249 [Lentzea xinjiangensis]|uniref:Uncharacterized protein n=1 Tax=Lentzea xinjiangensis TaxID=402600 RepID=A0A1H9GJN1_9PSEU|nr:hypothetical protein SAMN05216188_103249 [Lentzea xinjiangensis]